MKEKLAIDTLWFITFVAILTIWFGIVSAKGGLTDYRHSKLFKQITRRGWKLFFISALLLITWIFQEINNRNIAFNKNNELKIEQSKRDSKITNGINKGVDNATKQIYNGLSIAFAKQGFQYDTIKNEVRKLKDSIKTIPIGKEPLLIVNKIKIKDSIQGRYNKYLEIVFESVGASSYEINIKVNLYTMNFSKEFKKLGYNINMLGSNSSLPETQTSTYSFFTICNDNTESYIIQLFGNYMKSDGKKIKVNRFYTINVKNSSFGQPLDEMTGKLKKYIDQNK